MDGQEYVETMLNFASPDLRGFRAPGGYTQQHGRLQSGKPMRPGQQKVKVWNARLLDPAPTLQTHGFQLIAHDAIPWDLRDMRAVRSEFYPWCRELIRQATGCDEVRGGSNEYRRTPGLPTPNGSGGGYASGATGGRAAAAAVDAAGGYGGYGGGGAGSGCVLSAWSAWHPPRCPCPFAFLARQVARRREVSVTVGVGWYKS